MTTKKKPATKKSPAKRKKVVSARSICRKVISVPGINKRTGQLLKGWHYVNGKPEKAKPASNKKPTKKRGLGLADGGSPSDLCYLRNPDGSTTIYGSRGGDNPCPYGGRVGAKRITPLQPATVVTSLNGSKTKRKTATTKQTVAQNKFAVNSAKARSLVKSGKAKDLKSAWKMIK